MSTATRPRRPATPALREIQAPVRERLGRVSEEIGRMITANLPLMEQVKGHLLQMQGKLFRPTLVLLSSAVEEREAPRAVPLAAVVELVHVATLVHDDAVDHSALRRGMPTINAVFSHQVSVIMGDWLYSRALAELVEGGELEAMRSLVDASTQMSVGEMRQLMSVDTLGFSEDDYEALIRSKTAALIAAACEIGALTGAPRFRRDLALYGDRLGMAFQIADDLLDYTAESSDTGKPSGLDLREHKVTLPLIHALRGMSPAARQRVERLFAESAPSDEDIAEVVGIVTEYGGIDYARRRGERFADEAEAALGALPESPARAALSDAIRYVLDRRS
ncbi:MAG TPA: polyprenyl synthetase family protein [Gemmatimonadaceae bacterium]